MRSQQMVTRSLRYAMKKGHSMKSLVILKYACFIAGIALLADSVLLLVRFTTENAQVAEFISSAGSNPPAYA